MSQENLETKSENKKNEIDITNDDIVVENLEQNQLANDKPIDKDDVIPAPSESDSDEEKPKEQEADSEIEEEQKPLTPQQMMNKFVPFSDMPVGTTFELSGLRMRKMEYARRPDNEEGFFNALQLGIEDGYMWVKEDNLFRVVPANPRKNNNNNNRNRRRKNNRGRNRNKPHSNSNNNNRATAKPSNNNNNKNLSQEKKKQ